MKMKIYGSACLLLTTVIWGACFVAQSIGMTLIEPFTFQAIRCTLAVLILLPTVLIADRFKKDGKRFFTRWADRKLWKSGLLCGIPLFLATTLQQHGLVSTDAGKSAFLTAMYIVIVPLLGIFRKKKPSFTVLLSVLIAVAGLYCLCCVGASGIQKGDFLLLGCSVMFAVQILVVEQFGKDVDPLRLSLIQSLTCAVCSCVGMLVSEHPQADAIGKCAGALAYSGFLSMGLGYTMQIVGQKVLDSTSASLIMCLESAFAVLFGCLILHETLTVYEAVGCVLMFTAVILSQIPIPRKSKV